MPLAAPGNRSKSHAKLLHTCQIQVASADLASYLNGFLFQSFCLISQESLSQPDLYTLNHTSGSVQSFQPTKLSLRKKSSMVKWFPKKIASVLLNLIILDPGWRFTLGSRAPWSIWQQLRVFHVRAALIQVYFLALFHAAYIACETSASKTKMQQWENRALDGQNPGAQENVSRPHGSGKAKGLED